MAGDWIKMGVGLRTHPVVVRIASALKADRLRVIGGVYAVWVIFDTHSHDGRLPGYTFATIDADLGWKGFAKAMSDAGWMMIDEDGLTVPEYEEHNGPTAKRRAMETQRKSISRHAGDPRSKSERLSAWEADKCPQSDGTKSGQVSASDAPENGPRSRRREEEEKPKPETTPATSTGTTGAGQPPAGAVPRETEPDPPIRAAVDALRVGLPCGTDEYDAAAMLWATLHANGCEGTASHPVVIKMARQGVTIEQLKSAISEARKSRDGPLKPAYLAAIVERLKTEKPGNGKAQAWATDDGATEAKARELGLWPARPGESYHDLRNRIRAAIQSAADQRVK